MIYGISAHGLSAFWQLYQNPFELLPLGKQWMHESPIQFIIGHYLFSSLNWWMAFTFVQLIGLLLLIVSYFLLLKNRNIKHSEFFLVLAMSPFFLVILTWHGKPDIFLIASCFGMLATNLKDRIFFPLFLLTAVFSHPQITILYVTFFIILRQMRLDILLVLSLIGSYVIYFVYIHKLGEFNNRASFIFDNLWPLLETQLKQPMFSVFCTFGWLWLPIIYFRSSLTRRFFIVALISFGITVTTLDHTRIFLLLSLPILIYLSENISVTTFVRDLSSFLPVGLLLFFQFQKKSDGEIIDTAWSWFWLGKIANFFGFS
jgi:hypothetical protein